MQLRYFKNAMHVLGTYIVIFKEISLLSTINCIHHSYLLLGNFYVRV